MPKRTFITLILMSALTVTELQAQTRLPSQTQCQSWSEQHQRYARLRNRGGSLAQMDRWRDRQRAIEERMREGRCLQRFRIGY